MDGRLKAAAPGFPWLARFLRPWFFVFLWVGLSPAPSWNASSQAMKEKEEYTVKAQILLRLIPYVQWPEKAEGLGRPLLICVMGRSPFEDQLDRAILAAPVLQGRPVKVQYLSQSTETPTCDLLFLSSSMRREARTILDKVRGKPILTVSDDEQLAVMGVMINLLVQEDGRVHLVINRNLAVSEGFVLSSQMLRFAKIIDAPGAGR